MTVFYHWIGPALAVGPTHREDGKLPLKLYQLF
jgi:hypothetical protein